MILLGPPLSASAMLTLIRYTNRIGPRPRAVTRCGRCGVEFETHGLRCTACAAEWRERMSDPHKRG
jgi:hypothetical protein